MFPFLFFPQKSTRYGKVGAVDHHSQWLKEKVQRLILYSDESGPSELNDLSHKQHLV